jgi:cysteine synthase
MSRTGTERLFGLESDVVDEDVVRRSEKVFQERRVALPTFAELTEPSRIPEAVRSLLPSVGPDEPAALNLFRVHWHNDAGRRGFSEVPEHVLLPTELTGVDASIAVLLADRFPMIAAHKVLASYACLAPRIVTGQFDPTRQRAIWPSTGNYCRGGVAISKLLGCRGVAVLPEGMSRERFDWLEAWVSDPSDIIRTPGTESNVKEIYDECRRLAADEDNVIFNQFSEFGNHLAHYSATGRAAERVFQSVRSSGNGVRTLRGFVSATGSAGTLGAGDYLKERCGTSIAAVEALQCPTLLKNGFGEHNIQGIGDKHVPLIHNVMNTDFVVAVSDSSTDGLNAVFNTSAGRSYLERRHSLSSSLTASLASFGLSSICNVLAAIKLAKYLDLGREDLLLTVATDGSAMYRSELGRYLEEHHEGGLSETAAAELFAEHLAAASTDNLLQLRQADRERIFNLGYFTWVEQQGVPTADFVARRSQSFWEGIRPLLGSWDEMIREFNNRTGVLPVH